MQVAINARFLLPNRLEGIGRYSFELLSRLAVIQRFNFIFCLIGPFLKRLYLLNMKGHCLRPQARHPWLWYWHYESNNTLVAEDPVDVYWEPDAFLAKSSEGTKV